MQRETYISNEIDSANYKAQYDDHVRHMLKDKDILSYILKYSVREFYNYSLEESKAAIDGEPEVATRGIRPNAVQTLENESNIPGEGKMYFDIVFYVKTKDTQKKKLYINIEAQKSFYPGYDLVTRGIVYPARLISQQMDVEYTANNYDGVKKVYSIWICMNTPDKNNMHEKVANSIIEYKIEPEILYSEDTNEQIATGRYDLFSTIFINLKPSKTIESKHILINMLSTLLSQDISPEEKKKKLENDFHFPMSEQLEREVVSMCNLGEAIEEQGIEKGIQEGKSLAIYEMVSAGDISPELGAKKLNISIEQLKINMQKYDFTF